jgi:hypothetical protein
MGLLFFGIGLIGCKLRSFFFKKFNGLNFHAMENQNQIKSKWEYFVIFYFLFWRKLAIF